MYHGSRNLFNDRWRLVVVEALIRGVELKIVDRLAEKRSKIRAISIGIVPKLFLSDLL